MNIGKISILGSGWLGLPLARSMVAAGYSVKASTTSESRLSALSAAHIDPFLVDIAQPPTNLPDFLESQVLIVNIPSKDLEGFRRLLEQVEQSAIEFVIFVSSTSVYSSSKFPISEADGCETPTHPLVIIENMFMQNPAFQTTVLRFGGLFGYSRHPGRFIRGGRLSSHPESRVNLIHRDDCIAIIEAIIENQVWGEIFNCCADTHPSKRDFYERAAKDLGLDPPVFAESASNSYKVISSEKIKRRLGYDFMHPDLMAIEFDDDS